MFEVFTKHRYLLWQFTKRQIEQRHKGSLLGVLWTVIQPLMMMAIYTVVFGLIFKGHYQGIENQSTLDYALGIFLSLTIFQVISDVICISPVIVLQQPNLVKKVVFPLEILPISNLFVSLYQFSISLTLTFLGVILIGQGISSQSIFFFVAVAPLIPLCLGITLLLSSLGVFLRDLQQTAGPLSMLLMYSSAVFYSTNMVPANLWWIIKFNPILHIIEQARATLLWHHALNWSSISYSFVFGFGILALGILSFKKLKPAFADVI